jgi:hypothetical protein
MKMKKTWRKTSLVRMYQHLNTCVTFITSVRIVFAILDKTELLHWHFFSILLIKNNKVSERHSLWRDVLNLWRSALPPRKLPTGNQMKIRLDKLFNYRVFIYLWRKNSRFVKVSLQRLAGWRQTTCPFFQRRAASSLH